MEATASSVDRKALARLAEVITEHVRAAVMLIVGEAETSLYVRHDLGPANARRLP